MNPGEYISPMPRKTWVMCPVVSGYTTARLFTQDYYAPTLSGGATNTNMLVTFENVGNTYFSVKLRETDDRSVSGTRYDLTTALALVPGGQKTQTVSGVRPYLEVYCTSTTSNGTNFYPGGNLRMQIDSQRRWSEMGFSKDDPFYPPQLFQAKEVPGPI